MKKVMLAMSGGVDSSVALVLLKEKYDIMGVTLHLFDNEDIGKKCKTCCSLSDVEDAKAVASRFSIPHYVFNFKEKFKNQVINRFVDGYIKGETPNPCIDCNKYIKFDELLSRALSLDCDYIATGHYARVCYDEHLKRYLLKKAVSSDGDNLKDQSYVLYNLTQEQLSKTLFPLGELEKSRVREIAAENGLINANKPDSQDICFVPGGNYSDFIVNYTGKEPETGDFIFIDGKKVGTHKGLINYTVGQRRGLDIAFGKPIYVVNKDVLSNTVTVGENGHLFSKTLTAREMNWISISKLEKETEVKAKTRYKQKEQPCIIRPLDNNRVFAEFKEPQRAITPGQRVVFYDKDIVVGGGIIE